MNPDEALPTDDVDPLERERDLAWELYDVRPDHPEIARLAARILARQPDRTGIIWLLAMHLRACGRDDEARTLFLDILGRRDAIYVNTARSLRDLEQWVGNHAEAVRWAAEVVRERQDDGDDLLELGAAMALAGDLERGWQVIDDGVALTASTSPDDLGDAFMSRAHYLFLTFAPPERFIPAAEEAVRVDPSSEFVGAPLAWAYMHEGRFDDADALCRRLLRLDPTDHRMSSVLGVLRAWQAVVDRGDATFDEIRETGIVGLAWTEKRAQMLGIDLASALVELDRVLPAELRTALLPPADPEVADASPGEAAVAAWHDGQEPGAGSVWGLPGNFRVMSSTEIAAMDDAIEADPDAHPQWPQTLAGHYVQLMTDDDGGYLIATRDGAVVRRTGVRDEVVAPTLADWFWDRVAAFGGEDARLFTSRLRA